MSLTLTKTANPTSVRPGDTITFTLTITNTGTMPVQNITVTDITPNCTTYVPGSLDSNVPFTGIDLTTGITLASFIPPGVTFTITFKVIVFNDNCDCLRKINSNYITNQAHASYLILTITSSGTIKWVPESVNSNIVTIPVSCTDVQIKKESCKCTACLGEKIPYTIKVTNPGSSTANNIIVKDTIPSGVYISSSMPSIGTMSESNNVLTWTIPSLSSGASAVATVIVVATDSVCFDNRGYIINKSSVVSYNGISNINNISYSVITYIDCFGCKCKR
ncbi:MAG: hypothetical protein RR765_06360 [Peptostreptococcaceae bacterium]